LRHRDQVGRDPIHKGQLLLQLLLQHHLRSEQVLRETCLHRPLRSLGRFRHLHNPLQPGFGRFEQLAEHL
jgi:hypothetical protein